MPLKTSLSDKLFIFSHTNEAAMVGASNPQQLAMLGDVAVPGGVWSDRRC